MDLFAPGNPINYMSEGKVYPPYGRGSAPHGAYGKGSDDREEGLAPDASAILDHAAGNWKREAFINT